MLAERIVLPIPIPCLVTWRQGNLILYRVLCRNFHEISLLLLLCLSANIAWEWIEYSRVIWVMFARLFMVMSSFHKNVNWARTTVSVGQESILFFALWEHSMCWLEYCPAILTFFFFLWCFKGFKLWSWVSLGPAEWECLCCAFQQ